MFSSRTNWPLTLNRLTQTLNELRSSGVPLFDLTASNPTQCGFHYDSAGILSAFQNLTALVYDPQPKGTLAARCEVVRYYLDDHHVTVDPESLLLTTSTSEAYSYVFRLLCTPSNTPKAGSLIFAPSKVPLPRTPVPSSSFIPTIPPAPMSLPKSSHASTPSAAKETLRSSSTKSSSTSLSLVLPAKPLPRIPKS